MTIASEITRINNNIAAAYTACDGKGATMPQTQNSDNLATCISSISGGSSPVISSYTVTPTTSQQTITAPTGVDGYSPITVSAVTSSIDANITAGNIKDGVSILGVTGTYTGGGGGSFTGLPRAVENGVYCIPTSAFTWSLPSNATETTTLQNAFMGSGITSADMSSLQTITANSCLNSTFKGCTGLTSLNLGSLTTIKGSYSFQYICSGCTNLTNINLASVYSISGSSSLANAFENCTNLASIDLSSLTKILMTSTFNSAFKGCTSLVNVNLSQLNNISAGTIFKEAFKNCTALTSLSFPKLNSTSFGTYTTQFNNMLSGVTGCTVHFPSNLQTVIGSWADVTGGFGGSNITVLFDLTATS